MIQEDQDQPVDSGMSGEAVERAEWAWANLPARPKWTSLTTAEKALACHTFAALSTLQPKDEIRAEVLHDEIKAAYRAGAEDVLSEWAEVCECAPLPQHAGIGETSDTYWGTHGERIARDLIGRGG